MITRRTPALLVKHVVLLLGDQVTFIRKRMKYLSRHYTRCLYNPIGDAL